MIYFNFKLLWCEWKMFIVYLNVKLSVLLNIMYSCIGKGIFRNMFF